MKIQTSSFSWGRVVKLYQFNAPWIMKQTAIYFLFSLAVALLYIFIPSETVRMSIYGTCSTVMMFMFIWAPIVFTKGGDTRIVNRLLPASASEKFVFYMSYLLIVIGFACYFCPWIAEIAFNKFYPGEEGDVETIKSTLDISSFYLYSQILSTIAAMMTCFYCVVAVRRDRIIKAYLLSICVLFLMSSLNMFYGLKESVVLGIQEATGNRSRASETEIVEKVYSTMGEHMDFMIFCLAISIVYIVILMWLSYRSLYRRNL
ncbi:MAG: hypothetical protein K2M16_06700 [Muribaculaceae bacterium]|nr:hypothetical protein [Muribaculaceae bacterium]